MHDRAIMAELAREHLALYSEADARGRLAAAYLELDELVRAGERDAGDRPATMHDVERLDRELAELRDELLALSNRIESWGRVLQARTEHLA